MRISPMNAVKFVFWMNTRWPVVRARSEAVAGVDWRSSEPRQIGSLASTDTFNSLIDVAFQTAADCIRIWPTLPSGTHQGAAPPVMGQSEDSGNHLMTKRMLVVLLSADVTKAITLSPLTILTSLACSL